MIFRILDFQLINLTGALDYSLRFNVDFDTNSLNGLPMQLFIVYEYDMLSS